MWKMVWKVAKWGLVPVSLAITLWGYYSQAQGLKALGLPPFIWEGIGYTIFVLVVVAMLIGYGKNNKVLLSKNGVSRLQIELLAKSIKEETTSLGAGPIIKEAKAVKQAEGWKGFTQAELAQLGHLMWSMRLLHGHIDKDGLMDDLKNRKALNGNCWLCKKPRFEKGDSLETH